MAKGLLCVWNWLPRGIHGMGIGGGSIIGWVIKLAMWLGVWFEVKERLKMMGIRMRNWKVVKTRSKIEKESCGFTCLLVFQCGWKADLGDGLLKN